MPEYFLKAGWYVAGTGKVYHPNLPPKNDPPSWNQPYNNRGQQNVNCPPCPPNATWCGNSWCSLNATQNQGNNDDWIASDGQRLLEAAAAQPKPFFVAVGLHKPHTPYAYSSDIDALYPPADKIKLPTQAARSVPVGMPDLAWEHCSAIKPFSEGVYMPDYQTQQHRRAYCTASPIVQPWHARTHTRTHARTHAHPSMSIHHPTPHP